MALSLAANAAPLTRGKGAGPRLGKITVLEIIVPDRATIDQLSVAGYDIDAVRGNRVRIYADEDELRMLQASGLPLSVLKVPVVPAGEPASKGLGSYNTPVQNRFLKTVEKDLRFG